MRLNKIKLTKIKSKKMKIKKIKEKKYNLIINKKKMKTKNLLKRIKN
jgi:hypothetical protein